MRAFIQKQFRVFRTHSTMLLTILVVLQIALIALMLLSSRNLRELYSEAVDDNVKLFIENYELRSGHCPKPGTTEEENEEEEHIEGAVDA